MKRSRLVCSLGAFLFVAGSFVPAAFGVDMGVIGSGETRGAYLTINADHDWTFTGVAGQRVFLKANEIRHPNRGMAIEVFRPGGGSVTNPGCYTLDYTLPTTGTYVARVNDNCDAGFEGDYNLALLNIDGGPLAAGVDLDGGPIVPAQVLTGSLDVADLDAYQFYGAAGERVIVKGSEQGPGTPSMGIYAPGGGASIVTPCGTRQEVVLPASGVYTVVFQDCTSARSMNYAMSLQKQPGAFSHASDTDGGYLFTAPLTYVYGTTIAPSDADVYHFYANAGETLNLSVLNVTSTGMTFTVRPPGGGAALAACPFGGTACSFSAASTGLYTLVAEHALPNNLAGIYQLNFTSSIQPPANPGLYNPRPAVGESVANAFDGSYLGWDPVPSATSYAVYFGDDPLGPMFSIGSSATAHLALPVSLLTTGTTYTWRVVATTPTGSVEGPIWWFTFGCTATASITPPSLDFGDVLVGATSNLSFTLQNTGTCYLDPMVNYGSVPPRFSITSDTCSLGSGGTLVPDETCTVALDFSPDALATFTGNLGISGFLPEMGDQSVGLAGRGVSPDLQVVAVTDPPATPTAGTFDVTDTTRNTGFGPSTASVTRYRLSLDLNITRLDPLLAETRAVPALNPGEVSTGTVTVTLPASVPRGTYYLAACADGDGTVPESSETNNCKFSRTTIRVEPDLEIVSLSDPPGSGSSGGSFSVSEATHNKGLAAAEPSTVSFRLSLDTAVTATDPQLTGTRTVPSLGIGETSTGTTTVTIPASVPPGTFYLAACADGAGLVTEADEGNNCRVSTTQIVVRKADLRISSVSDPPGTGYAGTTFSVTDTTRNDGEAAAGASTTNFRLSLDGNITTSDPLLTGTRAVPALAVGAASTGSVTVTIPATVAQGTYVLAACADGPNAVSESDETNNCRATTATIQVRVPDLVVTAVTNPPNPGTVGQSFSVTDTTANNGTVPAVASTTRYRLSTDTAITSSDPLLTGTRAVPALAAGGSSSGTVTLTIPTTVTPGTYYLAACADDGRTVAETSETNNCRVSTGTMEMRKADLTVTSVTEPPVDGYRGTSFSVTARVENVGIAQAAASITRFRLTADTNATSADPQLTGTQSVPALAPGAFELSSTTVTIPASLPQGNYYLAACADGASAVSESSESNNCRVSTQRIFVQKPDLTVTAVTEPPADGDVGTTFDVTDTTASAGLTPVEASTTRYRLSLDAAVTAADPLLTGSRSVPALGLGASSSGTVTVTIPATVAQGTYFLAACADDPNLVAESSETNNCRVSAGTIDVLNPDLLVTAVSNPPANGLAGMSFDVTDTTANGGISPAGASTTRYVLTEDANVTSSDPVLTGTRTVPALAVGESSAGTASVTIPATVPQGLYYLAACADGGNAVTESNETNNCRVSASVIDLKKAELAATAVSDPPATGEVGTSFSVTDTVVNSGLTGAGASTTRYRLSADAAISGSDPLLTGTRAVPALGVGAASTGTVTVTIPGAVPQGTFYLAACADDLSAVAEVDEANNCIATTATIQVKKPDLAVTSVTDPPAGGEVGTSFTVTDTTVNNGIAPAAASTVRYRLSLDNVIASSDPLLTGTRAVPALGLGASSTGSATVTIPSTVAPGSYYLAACADDANVVSESNEANNCRLSAEPIDFVKPDLVVTSVSDPTTPVDAGTSFPVTDTTTNSGAVPAGASVTRYRLSLDSTVTSSDPLLTGTRAVPALAAGAFSTGTVSVTVPGTVAEGAYYLAACADNTSLVAESNEANNCRVSGTTVTVEKPDLVVTSVSEPPAVGYVGDSFPVTDSTRNVATDAPAGASTTRYRLSTDTTITAADAMLTGSRAVPALAVGATSSGSATVTIPGSVAPGVYYLGACADDASAVAEGSETNNCLASATTIDLRKADLVSGGITSPPAEAFVGTTFDVSEWVQNNGFAPAGASTTRYRLSLDTTVTSGDALLSGVRDVPALGLGENSAGTATVTVPATVTPGIYYLGACADDLDVVSESDETNNCIVSSTTVEVKKPDLVVTAVSAPPAEGFVGTTFDVTDTTANSGIASAGASTTRYRLSLDANITSSDPLLTGTRSVPALAAGAGSTGTVSVTIPSSVAQGTYYLAACADDLAVVAESSETNNCVLAGALIALKKPDLLATAVSNPPAEVFIGGTFSVTDTTENQGIASAGASTTRYRLSADTTINSTDTLLTGTRSVPALAVGAISTGSVTVTIPSSVAHGVYYLAACADDMSAVSESSETNNCVLAAATVEVKKPDLTITSVSEPPAESLPGLTFSVTDTTANGGAAPAAASTTRYRLSLDTTITTADTLLTGSRSVPALALGASSTGTVTVTIPVTLAGGRYYLAACADAASAVAETNETNNCRVSTTTVNLFKPDLVVLSISAPPALAAAGSTFDVTDTTQNASPERGAAASITRYVLSLDEAVTGTDPRLTGERAVPALGPGQSSTGTVTVTVSSVGGLADGTYWLYACADDPGVITEASEGNCTRAATQVTVARPDLSFSFVGGVPGEVYPGTTFTPQGSVANTGLVAASSSSSRFYLRSTPTASPGGTMLTGSMDSPAIAAGGSHGATPSLTVPAGILPGPYYLVGCADDLAAVSESDEADNCAVWGTAVAVRGPDLVVSAVSNPPAVAYVGDSFAIDDTTRNDGVLAAGASTTTFRLSFGELLGSRSVPALGAGASSSGTTTATVPAGTAPGFHSVMACADEGHLLNEENEGNNCRFAGTTVEIRASLPDLQVVDLSVFSSSVEVGASLVVADETSNATAWASAPASLTGYFLSLDAVYGAGDIGLTGLRSVPALSALDSSWGMTTVTVPGATPPGTYWLIACADPAGAVAERIETNNCLASSSTIAVTPQLPDLRSLFVSDPPLAWDAGGSFSVVDMTQNSGGDSSVPSVTRYYLSADTVVGAGDVLLSGTTSVPALSTNGTWSGSPSVTIPAATAVGVYWLFSCADDTGLIAESDETNNCAGSVTRMTVRAELTDSLDFGSTPSYLYPGQTFTQMNYVYNAFGTAGPSRVMFRLSLDTTITGADPYLGSLDTPELGPGAFQWFGANVTVPALPEGEYYIGACADELQVVPESSETNNCSVSPMTFNLRWAALSVTAIPSYPGTVIPGVSFSVTDTTSNAAGLGGDASAFAIEYRLSTDATITTADTLLTGGRLVPYLQAGQSDTGSTSVIVPVGTPSGHYYLGVCADWSNSVPELDEGNNCRATGGTIQVQ